MKHYHILISFCQILFFVSSTNATEFEINEWNSNQDTVKTCNDCHNTLINKKYIHAPIEDACDNCHSSNGKAHPNSITKGFSLADDVPTLCFYCHDEYSKKNIHAPAEAGECSMCHNPHSSDNPKLLNESRTDKLCFECHEMEIPKTDIVHSPVKNGACHECHNPHQSDNRSFLIDPSPQLCFKCHKETEEQSKARKLHAPFEDDCFNCHQSHSASEKALINEKTPALCYNCHDGVLEELNTLIYTHKPMTDEKSCSNCHSPHGSSERAILLKPEKDLCLTCHSRTYTTESGKTKNIKQKLKSGNNIHAPVEEGCVICHKPHAGNNFAMLNNKFPSGNYAEAKEENFALCFECHDSGLMLSEFTTDETNFRNGNVNMHYFHINGKKGKSCNTCHDVHGSKSKFLISEKLSFGKMEIDMNFLEKELGGSCATVCHAEKEYDRTYLPLETEEDLSTKIDSSSNETNITTKELIKTVPANRYQNFTEHVQSIDSSVIKFNEKMEKDMARKNDSIDQVLLAQNDSIAKSDVDSLLVINEISIDTSVRELAQIQPPAVEEKEEIKPEETIKDVKAESEIELTKKDLDKIEFPNINFAFSKSEIDEEGEKDIKVVAEYLRKNPILRIELHGYSDSIGSSVYNQYLSQLRAKQVKYLLVRHGVENHRITVKGFGETKSQMPIENSQDKTQNRRVEFIILNKED